MRDRSRYRYMVAVVHALRAFGGAASAASVYERLIQEGVADELDLQTVQRDGGTRFRKEVRWARKELYDAGYLDSHGPGMWSMTEKGASAALTIAAAQEIVRENTRKRRRLTRQSDEAALHEHDPIGAETAKEPMPTRGPPPVSWTGEISRDASVPTFTYVVRFGQRDVWKIGLTSDIEDRLADLNRHVPTEVIGEAWILVGSRRWKDGRTAYDAEQALLNELSVHRTVGERIVCDERLVQRVWRALTTGEQQVRAVRSAKK